MKKIYLSLILLTLIFSNANSQKVLHPYNLDFEDGELNRMPIGWVHPSYSLNNGYKARMTDFNPQSGKYCLEISRDTTGFVEGMYGSVMQSIEAKPFRGKKMIFRAAVKSQIASKKGAAHLWIRVKLKNDEEGNVDLTENQPIIYGDWQFYQMELEINDYADQINYGLMLDGGGKAWIDNCTIVDKDEKGLTNFNTIKLSEEQKSDLLDFSRIYGELRYFHPSTIAQKLDWDKFAIYGVKKMLEEKSDRISKLNDIFSIPAPGIYIGDKIKLENNSEKSRPKNAIEGLSIAYLRYITSYKDIYDCKPVNVYMPQSEAEGTVLQLSNIAALNLKNIKVKFKINFKSSSYSSFPQMLARFDNENDKVLKMVSFVDIPANTEGWKEYSLNAEVPENATFLRVGLSLAGDGEVMYDSISASGHDKNNKEIEISIKNPGFENDELGKISKGWKLSSVSEKAGYKANVVMDGNNKVLKISSNPELKVNMPEPDYRTGSTFDKLSFSYNLSLPMDSMNTLPYPAKEINTKELLNKFDFDPADYNSRISVAINIWNYLKHFHINKIAELDNQFLKLIDKVAAAQDNMALLEELNELLAISNDSQGRVWYKNDEKKFALPFLIKKVKNQYFVGKSQLSDIKEGTEIEKISGINADEFFTQKSKNISGNNPEYKYLRAIAEFRAGNLNEKVELTINNKVIQSEKNILINSLVESRPAEVSLIDSTIYYVDLTRLNDDDIKNNLSIFVKAKKVIFDLRGITQVSDHFLGLLTDKSFESLIWKVPGYAYPNKRDLSYKIISNNVVARKAVNGKFVFLVDAKTIGYSEALAYLVNKFAIGTTIGEETSGSMGESIPLTYYNDINMSVSGLKVFDSNKEISFIPVKPSINTSTLPNESGIKDKILTEAVNYLRNTK